MTPVADDDLLRAFLVDGDGAAFGQLVRRHERLVLSLVRRYARAPADASDLAQRTFLRAFQAARRTFRRRAPDAVVFRRWLVRVAVNLSKNYARDEAHRALESLGRGPSAGATYPIGTDGLERSERAERVRRAVLHLPRRQREVLTLRIDAELPFADIAAALRITENAAKVTFHHATRSLRALVAEDQGT